MEFVNEQEVFGLLKEFGIEAEPVGEEIVDLRMKNDDSIVRFHLACEGCQAESYDGAETVIVEKQKLPDVVEHMLHLLHLRQVLLVPVGKWRNIFDAVAFSLASNEDWQLIDAAATVELNQRDPLLCEPEDFSTLHELLAALYNDAEHPEQQLMLVSTIAPILIEIVPEGALRVSIGNQVLADEVAEAFSVS
ncbi:MAG: hypothetical protein O7G85_01085 [Planctomycetota bacterium]|nr:hypothetical protein [Planctomycetota bacterium]